MNVLRALKFSAGVSLLFGATLVSAAPVFPDVPDGHIFQKSIETLVQAAVIDGNPDGTFRPNENVNRAAMLKMLYKARGKTPDPLSVRCFPDVEIGSWYEQFVCDAAARRFVNGYADGTFRPDSPVNRVEALKMIMTVFELPLETMTDDNREIVNFGDVSLAAWYTQYLLTAYNLQILPIPGQEGGRFYPDRSLLRGEAAAMIYNALRVDFEAQKGESSVSSAASTGVSSHASEGTEEEEEEGDNIVEASFPFVREGKFRKKDPTSYRFDVVTSQTVNVVASLQPGQSGQISCRLYLLGSSGFSDQYFLGYQEGGSCYLRSTISPGTYQLQLQPTVAETTFSASVQTGTGDGNDGFREARLIFLNAERTDKLTASDFEDWYTFSLLSQQRMTVILSNAAEIRCIVYAMSDVNLASFEGPQCNQVYDFPPGTYYIAIGRKAPKNAQQSYTLKLVK